MSHNLQDSKKEKKEEIFHIVCNESRKDKGFTFCIKKKTFPRYSDFFEIQTYEGIKTNQWCFPECAESEQDT